MFLTAFSERRETATFPPMTVAEIQPELLVSQSGLWVQKGELTRFPTCPDPLKMTQFHQQVVQSEQRWVLAGCYGQCCG